MESKIRNLKAFHFESETKQVKWNIRPRSEKREMVLYGGEVRSKDEESSLTFHFAKSLQL